jgi:hypothetical protein
MFLKEINCSVTCKTILYHGAMTSNSEYISTLVNDSGQITNFAIMPTYCTSYFVLLWSSQPFLSANMIRQQIKKLPHK